jgi:hypothetical protein
VGVNEYRFVDRWRVRSTLEEVTEIMLDVEGLPRWWPSFFIDAKVLEPGDPDGIGRVVAFHVQGGRLLYTLRWTGRTIETRHPHGFRMEVTGHFVGTADWTFEQDGEFVDMTLEWTVRAVNPFLSYASYVMRPLLANNHTWTMRVGERSLKLELARRRSRSAEERARISPPPAPLTAMRILPVAAVILAACAIGVRRLRR